MTPPCGVPVTDRRTCPSLITPARNIARSSLSTDRSLTRSCTARIKPSCGIASKQLAISVSTTHRLPRQDSSTSTCRASCGARRGRNPNEHANISASKIGSSTIFTAACTTRSATEGIDNSLRSHDRSRTSLRWTLSPSAWNRRPGSALAARYSACCKARTGSITDPEAAELAETALTGLLQDEQYAPTKQRPFPHRRLCCPLGSSSTTAASDAHPARRPVPGVNRL